MARPPQDLNKYARRTQGDKKKFRVVILTVDYATLILTYSARSAEEAVSTAKEEVKERLLKVIKVSERNPCDQLLEHTSGDAGYSGKRTSNRNLLYQVSRHGGYDSMFVNLGKI